MPASIRLLLAAAFACTASAAGAQTVTRCVDATGKVSYQSQDCASGQQTEVKLHVAPADPTTRTSQWKGYVAPKEAVMTFFYDPKDEPVGFSAAQMESDIRAALAAWGSGCSVRLVYGGQAPAKRPATPDRIPIRWAPEYMRLAHPADARSGVAGTGSPTHGISLKPRFHEGHMLSVLIHEVGHVLGLPHNHADVHSVMSYLRDEAARRNPMPSESDFVACNESMKKMFGIDDQRPGGAANPASAPRMSDREALERIHGKKPER